MRRCVYEIWKVYERRTTVKLHFSNPGSGHQIRMAQWRHAQPYFQCLVRGHDATEEFWHLRGGRSWTAGQNV